MSLKNSLISLALFFFSLAVLVVSAACGGSSQSSSPTPLSAAQVQAITTEMANGFSSAMSTSNTSVCPGGASNQLCFNTTANCTAGGTIAITGQYTTSLDANNTGQISGTMTFIPTNCAVNSTSLVLNGDPSLKFAATLNIANSQLTNFTATETGGVLYGPNPTGVCDSNLTITVSVTPTQTCRIKGTACGQAVDYTCSVQ